MRQSRFLSHLAGVTAVAVLGLSVPVGSAFASNMFDYGSYSVVNEVNVHIYGTGGTDGLPTNFEAGYFGSGQIVLNGIGLNAGQQLDVWCIDATHILQNSFNYSVINSGFNDAGGASDGAPIDTKTLGEIGALVNYGDANITQANVSAAVQLAIWTIEYGAGAAFDSDSNDVNTLVGTLVADAIAGGSGFKADFNLQEVVDLAGVPNNQGLIYLTPAPLPSTWTMMLAGLVGLGFVALRRRKLGLALA